MRYIPLNNSIYKRNRLNFMDQMKGNCMAIFNSNDIYPVSADSELPFAQHRDMFHLAGIDQEETILILYPSSKESKTREVLFIRRSDEHTKIWEGEKLTKDAAYKTSGIQTVYWLQDLEKILFGLTTQCDTFYINTNEHYRAKDKQSGNFRFSFFH